MYEVCIHVHCNLSCPNAHRLVFAFLCVYEGVIEIKVNCMTEITRYLLYCKTLFNEFIVIRNDYKY